MHMNGNLTYHLGQIDYLRRVITGERGDCAGRPVTDHRACRRSAARAASARVVARCNCTSNHEPSKE